MERLKKIIVNDKFYEVLFILIMFILAFMVSINIKYLNAPDERMKELVCQYIFKNGQLPVGSEKTIIEPNWGTSYAFTPILSYMISVVFMKITSFFTTDALTIFKAARFTSVLWYTFTIAFIIKIANILFKEKKIYKWLFTVLASCLPGFVFLGTYLNNDSFALLSISIIIYAWLLGINTKWNWKAVALLGFRARNMCFIIL